MLVARWRVSVLLVLAILSFWLLWVAPLVVGAISARAFVALWTLSVPAVRKLGFLWTAGFSASLTFCILPALVFLLNSFRLLVVFRQTRGAPASPSGLMLNEAEAPELFELVSRIRQRVGIDVSPELWIDLSADIRLMKYRDPVRPAQVHALTIGLPALASISAEQLEAAFAFNLAFLAIPTRLLDLVRRLTLLSSRFLPPIAANGFYMRSRRNYFALTLACCNRASAAVKRYATAQAQHFGGDFQQAHEAILKVAREFQEYWAAHVQILLQTGHLIPIADGFQQFRESLSERPECTALSFVRGAQAIEARLMSLTARSNPTLESISWGQAGTVLLNHWAKHVEAKKDCLRESTVGDICDLIGTDAAAFGHRVFQEPGRLYDPNQLRLMAAHLLGAAIATTLSKTGWRFSYSGPATAVAFEKDGNSVNPFALIGNLLKAPVENQAWQATCSSLGIGNSPLA